MFVPQIPTKHVCRDDTNRRLTWMRDTLPLRVDLDMCVNPQQVYRAKLFSKILQKLSLFEELDMQTSRIRDHNFFADLNYQLKEDPPDHGGHNSSQMLLLCKELHWVQSSSNRPWPVSIQGPQGIWDIDLNVIFWGARSTLGGKDSILGGKEVSLVPT